MLVHVFGGVSSPSCASFALQRTAEDNQHQFDKEAIEAVRRNFYVDDCLKFVGSEQDAIRLIDQLHHLLAKGGFRLTKWISNSTEVIESVPASERAGSVKKLDLDHLPVERALESDLFGFKITVKDRPLTRRGILSVVSSIYDPLRFLSLFILRAKMILSDLCKKGLNWDDQIPNEDRTRWEAWLGSYLDCDSLR